MLVTQPFYTIAKKGGSGFYIFLAVIAAVVLFLIFSPSKKPETETEKA